MYVIQQSYYIRLINEAKRVHNCDILARLIPSQVKGCIFKLKVLIVNEYSSDTISKGPYI